MKTIQNYAEFNEVIQNPLVLIIAKTKACVVCAPITEKLRQFMEPYPEIPVYQIYLEDVLEFQGQQLIFTVPTIVGFSEGKEILRESRFIDFDKIERLLQLFSE